MEETRAYLEGALGIVSNEAIGAQTRLGYKAVSSASAKYVTPAQSIHKDTFLAAIYPDLTTRKSNTLTTIEQKQLYLSQ